MRKRSSLRRQITLAAVGALLILSQLFSVWNLYKTREKITDALVSAELSSLRNDAGSLQTKFDSQLTDSRLRRAWMRTVFNGSYSTDAVLYYKGEEIANQTPYLFDVTAANGISGYGENGEKVFLEKINGKRLLITYTEFAAGSQTEKAGLLHFRDITYVTRQTRTLFLEGVAMTLSLSALLILFLLTVLRRILRPLYRLRTAANVIAGGEYSARVEDAGPAEVEELAGSFNRMAANVEEHVRELAEMNEKQRQLLGALSHELKTPMTAIQGYAQLLQRVSLTPERQTNALNYIEEECRRLSRLSEKMLLLTELSGENAVEMQEIPVAELLSQAEQATRYRLAGRNQHLRLKTEPGIVCGDRDLLLSLLANLIDNAGKASPDGGEILLSGGPDGLFVTDHGCGIPPEELERVKEPFYRVDKARSRREGGAGLGLALCSQIARIHGGELVIESQTETDALKDKSGEPVHGTKIGILLKN